MDLKKHQQKEWITVESLTKIEDRKRKRETVNNRRTRVVKRSPRKDKKEYVNRLAAEAEQAAYSRNMKQLYDITKQLSR